MMQYVFKLCVSNTECRFLEEKNPLNFTLGRCDSLMMANYAAASNNSQITTNNNSESEKKEEYA